MGPSHGGSLGGNQVISRWLGSGSAVDKPTGTSYLLFCLCCHLVRGSPAGTGPGTSHLAGEVLEAQPSEHL